MTDSENKKIRAERVDQNAEKRESEDKRREREIIAEMSGNAPEPEKHEE